jgi:hypothetical protein
MSYLVSVTYPAWQGWALQYWTDISEKKKLWLKKLTQLWNSDKYNMGMVKIVGKFYADFQYQISSKLVQMFSTVVAAMNTALTAHNVCKTAIAVLCDNNKQCQTW